MPAGHGQHSLQPAESAGHPAVPAGLPPEAPADHQDHRAGGL